MNEYKPESVWVCVCVCDEATEFQSWIQICCPLFSSADLMQGVCVCVCVCVCVYVWDDKSFIQSLF